LLLQELYCKSTTGDGQPDDIYFVVATNSDGAQPAAQVPNNGVWELNDDNRRCVAGQTLWTGELMSGQDVELIIAVFERDSGNISPDTLHEAAEVARLFEDDPEYQEWVAVGEALLSFISDPAGTDEFVGSVAVRLVNENGHVVAKSWRSIARSEARESRDDFGSFHLTGDDTDYDLELRACADTTALKTPWLNHIFVHAQIDSPCTLHGDYTISYQTWDRSLVTAKLDGSDFLHLQNSGDWARARRDSIINYLGIDDTKWTARIEEGEFVHAPNGDFDNAVRDCKMNYVGPDGVKWCAWLRMPD